MTIKEHLLAIAVVLIWGFNFVVIRWGVEDVHPMTMTLLRFLLTATPMVFIVKKPDIAMRYVITYGVLFGTGVWGLANLAVFLGTPAGIASLLLQMSPFLTVLAAVVVFKETLKTKQVVGIIIALLGFMAICIFKSDSLSYVGLGLMLMAAIFWTICNIIIKIAKPKDVVSFTVWSSLFVPVPILLLSVVYALFYGVEFNTLLQMPNLKGWISIVFQALIVTLFGYAVWTRLISQHGLSKVTPYSLLVPISGLFFGWLLYGEVLSITELIGSGLVLLGLILLTVNFTDRKKILGKRVVKLKP
ncbi:EamA family transporter [Psychrobacter sp. DM4]|uniref:EamA family transporter n=1 Tax=Psychrobacter sp. DM4 TaxID=3440637 RepID=UPI003F505F5D